MNKETRVDGVTSLSRRSRLLWTVVALLAIPLIGVLDHAAGSEPTFSIFYVAPVAAAAWFSGRRAGLLAALAGALVWLLADAQRQASDASSVIPYWNAAALLGALLVAAILTARLQSAKERVEAELRVRTAALTQELAEHERAAESCDLFRRLLDQAHDAIEVIDPETGRFIDVNERAQEHLGYSREELLTLGVPDIDPIVDQAAFAKYVAGLREQGYLTLESLHRRKDGSTFPAEVYVAYVELDRPYLLSIARDISERKRAEETLRKAEARQYGILENAPVAMFQSTPEGQAVYVNPACADLFGYASPREQIETVNRSSAAEVLYADPRQRTAFVAEVRSSGGAWKAFETRFRRKDGSVFDGLLHFCERVEPDGQQRYLYGFARELTTEERSASAMTANAARLQQALTGTVTALGATVDLRDPYTGGHQRRVAELACAIAERLEWSKTSVDVLRTAAVVHDIGKIAVPAEILSKPGRFNEAENLLVQGHVRAAYDILAAIDFGVPIATIVLQHHERLDGSGYPNGLTGEEILPAARVLAVADVVEAMVSHRPYRPALPLREALGEIRSGMGTRYDAEVAAACLQLIEEDRFAFSD